MRTCGLSGRDRGICRRGGLGYVGHRQAWCQRVVGRRIGRGRIRRIDFLGHEQFVLMISQLHNRELSCRSQVGIYKSMGVQS